MYFWKRRFDTRRFQVSRRIFVETEGKGKTANPAPGPTHPGRYLSCGRHPRDVSRLGPNAADCRLLGAPLTLEKAASGSHFLRMPSRQASRRDSASADLFEAPVAPTPAGFRYAPDLFSPAAEKALVAQFETLPFKPFEFHGYLGNRRVVSFGYRYDYAGRALRSAEEMPAFLAAPATDRQRVRRHPAIGFGPGARNRICAWCRHRLASRQAHVPRRRRLVLPGSLRPAAPPRRGCGLGARGGGNRAALGVSASWPGAHRLGAQHPADGRVALFRDVPILPARLFKA